MLIAGFVVLTDTDDACVGAEAAGVDTEVRDEWEYPDCFYYVCCLSTPPNVPVDPSEALGSKLVNSAAGASVVNC